MKDTPFLLAKLLITVGALLAYSLMLFLIFSVERDWSLVDYFLSSFIFSVQGLTIYLMMKVLWREI